MSVLNLILLSLITLLANTNAFASEGYLGADMLYGKAPNSGDTTLMAGGWIMGGDDEWRAGAAGYGLISDYGAFGSTASTFSMGYAGALVYWIPDLGGNSVVLHLGSLLGGGFLNVNGQTRKTLFWVIEPNVLLSFQITHWFGFGFRASYRFIPSVTNSQGTFNDLSGLMGGLSLIIGRM